MMEEGLLPCFLRCCIVLCGVWMCGVQVSWL